MNGPVHAIETDGTSLYIGGKFTSFRGTNVQNLIKVDAATCTLDTTFTLSTGANISVNVLKLSGSTLYIGGAFTTYRGFAAQGLAKLDSASGVMDTTFSTTSGIQSGKVVSALYLGGGGLFVGGDFTTYKGVTTGPLVKVSTATAALDTTFNTAGANFATTSATNLSVRIRALAGTGNAIWAGGYFHQYRGSTINYLAKINATDGSLDTGFSPFTSIYNTSNISSLALSSDGTSLWAVGLAIGTAPYRHVLRLDATTGAWDTDFATTKWESVSYTATNSIVLSGDEQSIFVAGEAQPYLQKFNAQTYVSDTTFNSGMAAMTAFAPGPLTLRAYGDRLYVGGDFIGAGGTAASKMTSIDLSTGGLTSGWNLSCDWIQTASTNTIAILGSSFLFGGHLNVCSSYQVNHLNKRTLALAAHDSTFQGSPNPGGPSLQVRKISTNGQFLVGEFRTYRGDTNLGGLVKINTTTGTADTTFHAVNSAIYDPVTPKWNATYNDAPLFDILNSGDNSKVWITGAGGGQYRGSVVKGVMKIDPTTGAIDPAFAPVPTLSSGTSSSNAQGVIAITGNAANPTTLYAGGLMISAAGNTCGSLLQMDASTGALGSCAGAVTGQINALAYSSTTSSVYALGSQYSAGQTMGPGLLKFDASTLTPDTTFNLSPQLGYGGSRQFNLYGKYPFGGGIYSNSNAYFGATPVYNYGALEAADSTGLYVGGAHVYYRGQLAPFLNRVDLTTGALND